MIAIFILCGYLAKANLYCTNSSCTSCSAGYYLLQTSCLALCPTGYTSNTSSKSCVASGSAEVFYLTFYNFFQYTASSIGNFQSPNNLPFNNQNKASPIPTSDRGFYFASSSKLYSTTS